MILFVGDRPSKRTDPNVPFKGAACEARLIEWINSLTTGSYRICNSNNTVLLVEFTYFAAIYGVPIVALGNKAARALRELDRSHYKLPHPSGRNRQINNKEFIAKKLADCKSWLNDRGVS